MMAEPRPIPIDIPPGIVKADTDLASAGRWTGGDKVRFRKGKAEKMKGAQKLLDDQLLTAEGVNIARGALGFTTLSGVNTVMVGSAIKLWSATDDLVDRTPLRDDGTLGADPFAVVDTLTTVTVTHVAHGLAVGDHVYFDDATAGGGITIDGEYVVVTVPTLDTYTITHSAPATSTDATTGGGAVLYEYEISPGGLDTSYGLGWGAGGWGEGTWGTERTGVEGVALDLRVWWLAKYGSQILATPTGGTIYKWDEPNNDARAIALSGAPDGIRAMFMTEERYIFALGQTDLPMTVAWPDRDDPTDWTPISANTANERTLQGGSKLMGGTPLISGLSMVWSDTNAFLFQYTGSDFVYDSRSVGEKCGLIAPLAFATYSGTAFWMSPSGFHYFDGGVQSVPNENDIVQYVFNNLNAAFAAKICCGYNPENNEIWWLYPHGSEEEPGHYAAVCLDDFSWTVGTFERSAFTVYPPPAGGAIMVGTDGYIYAHEVGYDLDGAAMRSYVESGLSSVADGSAKADIFGFVPDFKDRVGSLTLDVYTKEYPEVMAFEDQISEIITPDTGRVDLRASGRHFGFRITSDSPGGNFRFGLPKVMIQPAGTRP